eukprot:CAMPEP_0174297116 /NCGR_PEP_ID=MMETSP0809-20121228/50095_1 /TAXON_ID=73025 ORGANISM="Eutreptiella gymnastica-like, Strain CCMP1594" /NCGR_SAMPLE_ID=MMETSP0809 /ASSEMBLY_ACC=CAM_ASM_000658 /LENGTH=59 /DNA_ID=CAMNT_0015400679 /DNA_START=84 /DNA_END=263 /DNA_ORIENTATION=+
MGWRGDFGLGARLEKDNVGDPRCRISARDAGPPHAPVLLQRQLPHTRLQSAPFRSLVDK